MVKGAAALKSGFFAVFSACMLLLASCGTASDKASRISSGVSNDAVVPNDVPPIEGSAQLSPSADSPSEDIVFGDEHVRGFLFDNVLHSESDGEIHFGLYIPEDYDGSESYALYVTLPGYEGLYFQGVGVNIRAEDYGIEAQKYNEKMIILAPQLNDWGMTSARQTAALTRTFLAHYNIDPDRVYLNGYSGGGETGSLVMEIAPELYTAFLHCSSQWDGELAPLVEAMTPVYMVTGENDSYYGSGSVRETYDKLVQLYRDKGLTDEEIQKLVVLDLKDQAWFDERGIRDQHGGGGYFAREEDIMGWLFGEHGR